MEMSILYIASQCACDTLILYTHFQGLVSHTHTDAENA